VAAEEGAEEASGLAVGDAVVAVVEEAGEDDIDAEGDLDGGEVIEVTAELAPAGDTGEWVAGRARGRALAGGDVVEAAVAAAQGEATAFFTVGQDVGAFGTHGFSFETGSWKQETGSGKQGAESREQDAESRTQGAGQGWVCGMDFFSGNGKAPPAGEAFFFFYSIYSG
jgi:hypothetical protein